MKICSACVLPETFPGIRFDAEGVCNYCGTFEKKKASRKAEKNRYREKFIALIEKVRQGKQRSYDAVMAYSGGKDSSYTLMLLKRDFGLNVLALTFDNGFLSPQALLNIRKMVDALSVDHILFSPSRAVLMDAFRRSIDTDVYPMKALERASAICNTCINLVKSTVLKTAIETEIPFVAYGWSPGQAPLASSVMKLNVTMIRQMQESFTKTTGSLIGEKIKPYALTERHYQWLSIHESVSDSGLYAVHPLAFHEYREEAVSEEIKKFGWLPPPDTDPNSSNCLLNVFANHLHLSRFGFHPYAMEIAGLVRYGCMTREEGLSKLSERPDPEVLRLIRQQLGLASTAQNKA